MNVEEIKKKIRGAPTITTYEPPPLKEKEERVYSKKSATKENHASLFSLEGEEEEHPNSKVWDWDDREGEEWSDPFYSMSAEEFVKGLGLCNEKYDWRLDSRKGRKSRENFSKYIISVAYT